jgi:hypothetical protein
MATSLPCGDQPNKAFPLSINNDKAFFIDHSDGDFTLFSIIIAVVDARQDISLEDQGRINEINCSFLDNFPALGFIPLEVHGLEIPLLTECGSIPSPNIDEAMAAIAFWVKPKTYTKMYTIQAA